jgi:iron complex outermembrane recepter protein
MVWEFMGKQQQIVLLVSSILILTAEPVWARTNPPPSSAPQPARTVQEWLDQIQAQGLTAQKQVPQVVTRVRLEQTARGLDISLDTVDGKPLEIDATRFTVQGNSLIATIANTELKLPEGKTFRTSNPTSDIAEVLVTQLDPTTLQVTVVGNPTLPKTAVTLKTAGLAYALNPEGKDDQEIVVTGGAQRSYSVPNATSGTRTDTPIRDIPQSIQVIPQPVLRDQQVIRFDEAFRNVSGVQFDGTSTTSDVRYTIRGFNNAPVLIDGFRQFGPAEVPNVAGLERIEVLRGPASILFGEVQPGGIINAITNKPLSRPFYEAELQVGSRSLIRPRLDVSGPLTGDGKLLYRVNLAASSLESFQDYTQNYQQVFIAPALTWNISQKTQLNLQLQYALTRKPFDSFGGVALGRTVADTPRNFIANEPDDFLERKFLSVGYKLEHRFNQNWTLTHAFRYANSNIFSDRLTIPLAFNEQTGILARVYALDDFNAKDYGLQTSVVGRFTTGSVRHTLLFGVDYAFNNTNTLIQGSLGVITPLNIFNPVYGQVPRPPLTGLALNRRVSADRLGIFLQDQITFTDQLKLLLGVRYESVSQRISNEVAAFSPTGADFTQVDSAWTPRVGLVYQPIQSVSLYASYSQSFAPSLDAVDITGRPLEAERGQGWEAGVKVSFFRDRLSATLAYFDATKQNVATADPRFPIGGISVATGEQRSRGVEFDLSGEILPGWNIIASYAYTDATIRQDTLIPSGNLLPGVPRHSASLWSTYEIQRGAAKGLGFGFGFNLVGGREGDRANSFRLDGYSLYNAAIFYRRDNWRFAINLKNITNAEYYLGTPASRISGIIPGEPLTVIGSFTLRF